jgi:hypothetical protein
MKLPMSGAQRHRNASGRVDPSSRRQTTWVRQDIVVARERLATITRKATPTGAASTRFQYRSKSMSVNALGQLSFPAARRTAQR